MGQVENKCELYDQSSQKSMQYYKISISLIWNEEMGREREKDGLREREGKRETYQIALGGSFIGK